MATMRSASAARRRFAARPALGAHDARRSPSSRPPPAVRAAHQPALRDHLRLRHRGERARIKVAMTLRRRGAGAGAALVPGLDAGRVRAQHFARWVSNFTPDRRRRHARWRWDKLDYDTWRVQPGRRQVGQRPVRLPGRHARQRDGLGPAGLRAVQRHQPAALSRGPRLRLPGHRDGQDRADWQVATGMQAVPQQPGSLSRGQLPRPGRHAVLRRPDRLRQHAGGRRAGPGSPPIPPARSRARRATQLLGRDRQDDPRRVGGVPGDAVAALHRHDDLRLDATAGAARSSTPTRTSASTTRGFIGNPILASITAHEIFHAWNVKRLRPADMVPYRYDQPRAHRLALGERGHHRLLRRPRAGARRHRRLDAVPRRSPAARSPRWPTAPPTALEDASLSTWIHPTDGSEYLYYPKGSLAGLPARHPDPRRERQPALARRRDARALPRDLQGGPRLHRRGVVGRGHRRRRAGKSFADFAARYVDGREPYPWAQVLPLAGLRMVTDTDPRAAARARRGAATRPAGSWCRRSCRAAPAEEAGVRARRRPARPRATSPITDPDFGPKFRERFGKDGRPAAADPGRARRPDADAQRQGPVRAAGGEPAGGRPVGVRQGRAGPGGHLQGHD